MALLVKYLFLELELNKSGINKASLNLSSFLKRYRSVHLFTLRSFSVEVFIAFKKLS